jgi:hypothetical protein
MLGMLPGGLLELGAAAIGAHLGGLAGLSIGWVIAICIESMFMFHTVYKAVWPSEQHYQDAEAIWLANTSPLPAMSKEYVGSEAIWLVDTSLLPSIKVPTMTLPDIKQINKESYIPEKSLLEYKTH